MSIARRVLTAAMATVLMAGPLPARADTNALRISRTTTMAFLPLMVMEQEKLLEREAARRGITGLAVSFVNFSGPGAQIDALLSGSVDIVAIGATGLLTLWAKSKGTPSEIKGVAALSSMPMALNTRNPKVRTIADLTESDRIAVPSVKISFDAMLLQMAAAKQWGMAGYARLDPLTVSLGQMDAVAAILSGRSEVNNDFTTPPFLQIEQASAAVRPVVTLKEILGDRGTIATTATTVRFGEMNPGLLALYRAALGEAMAIIAQDKGRAVDDYVGATGERTTPRDILLRAVSDPDAEFTTIPRAMMTYARFMKETGILRRTPDSVGELFFTLPDGGS